MGFLSKIKKAIGGAVSKAPGGAQLQKAIGKDPIAQAVMKVDPLARDIAGAHGLVAPAAQAAAPAIEARKGFQPPTRQPGWQEERVASMRARFGRPAAPVGVAARPAAVAPAAAMPAAPVATAPQRVTVAPNPVAADLAQYQQAWTQN